MTNQPTCAICAKPLADGATACTTCARNLAQALQAAAGHAEDAWTVIARQARYGTSGGARAEPELGEIAEDRARNAVKEFAWAASIERPLAGALRPEPLPIALGAADDFHAVENTLTTWARDMDSDADTLAGAAVWLAEHVELLRHHEAAAEAFDELEDACHQLERLVDRPGSDRRLVGVCDCGAILYARHGQTVIQCGERTCGASWDVERSREILLRHLDGQLLTAAETARMAAYLDPGRTTEQIRMLIASWAKRGQVAVRGEIGGAPTYRFGEIRARLAETPRRQRDGAAA